MIIISYIYLNYDTKDVEVILKEYLMKLYKIDKNMINVYINTVSLLAINYYNLIFMYVTKTREFIWILYLNNYN
jgi:hypothetical protein